jgi:hypothetical protein
MVLSFTTGSAISISLTGTGNEPGQESEQGDTIFTKLSWVF